MHLRCVLIIFVALVYCTACSAKNQITVDQPSLIRWFENENELEVYAVVSNSTNHDVSFQASFIFLDDTLKEAVGFESDQLETDDRNNHSPFKLRAFNETVFIRKYKAHSKLTHEMLSGGVGVKVTAQQKTYTIAIKHVEKMAK
ncbi:hypothetical protein [Cohnella boryungensis]|uniref:Intracellular proteinase inhibitor BsuPI domain-containing protein n=1 Tax=Cohnella boryungensis TaxID=768479 RepID=A0ABV8SFH8_9BACL